MFGTEPWYFAITKKYISLFGAIFSDVQIVRTIEGQPNQIIDVPITFGPRDKLLARVLADPEINRAYALRMPVMGFDIVSRRPDPERKLNTLGKTVKKGISGNTALMAYQYNPVPWNLTIELYIVVKNQEDGYMILEQIVPKFPPHYTPLVELVPELDLKADIPIILNDWTSEDHYQGGFETRQWLMHTLTFTLKGYYYGPVIEQPVIKFANVTFYIPNSHITDLRDAVGNTAPSDRVTVQPGLTANGEPTSNISLSIPYQQIEANDNFGYIITKSGIIIT